MCVLLPWQRGWCWVQLGPRCQVTAELWERWRGAWASGKKEEGRRGRTERWGYEDFYKESEQQRLEARGGGGVSLKVEEKKKAFIWVRAADWKIRCFSSPSAPSCQRILILGCITKHLCSPENKINCASNISDVRCAKQQHGKFLSWAGKWSNECGAVCAEVWLHWPCLLHDYTEGSQPVMTHKQAEISAPRPAAVNDRVSLQSGSLWSWGRLLSQQPDREGYTAHTPELVVELWKMWPVIH